MAVRSSHCIEISQNDSCVMWRYCTDNKKSFCTNVMSYLLLLYDKQCQCYKMVVKLEQNKFN